MKHKAATMLRQHKRRMGPYHGNSCVQCDYKFYSWEEHKKHVENSHGGQWLYWCGLCSEAFDDLRERRCHRK